MATDDPRPAAGSAPDVSVVLPLLNEERDIGRVLDELGRQQAPPNGFEVLVADGGSEDATRAIVARRSAAWPALRLLENPRRLSSAGRNVGARAACGRYILFLDGHCALPREDYLQRLVSLFEETGAACLVRPQPLNRLVTGDWARAIAAARHSRWGHAPGSDIYGGAPGFTDPRSAGAAYRRERLIALGGYDERFDACEDVEFNHRLAAAGESAYRHPDLAVAYRPRASLGGLWRQMVRYGRGRARLMARHPRFVPWPLLGLSGIGLALLAGAFWAPRIAATTVAAGAALWLLLVGAESIRLGRASGGALRVALSLATIQAGLLAGFWRGLPDYPRFRRAPGPDDRL